TARPEPLRLRPGPAMPTPAPHRREPDRAGPVVFGTATAPAPGDCARSRAGNRDGGRPPPESVLPGSRARGRRDISRASIAIPRQARLVLRSTPLPACVPRGAGSPLAVAGLVGALLARGLARPGDGRRHVASCRRRRACGSTALCEPASERWLGKHPPHPGYARALGGRRAAPSDHAAAARRRTQLLPAGR